MNVYELEPMPLQVQQEYLTLRQSQIHFPCFSGDSIARRDLLVALNGDVFRI